MMANAQNYTKILAESMMKTKEVMMANLFNELYANHEIMPYNRIEMPRRGRYQIWQGQKMVADKIKHRREALAIMKLMQATQE